MTLAPFDTTRLGNSLRGAAACVATVMAMLLPARPAWASDAASGAVAPVLRGFGTIGLVHSDLPTLMFRRDGQIHGPSGSRLDAEVDSNLGIQVDWRATPWLSAMAQAVTMRRLRRHVETDIDLAFVRAELSESLELRLGRLGLPAYAVSESRWVNFAQTPLRPPEEIYGLALLEQLDGVDLRWRYRIGDGQLDWQALAGRSNVRVGQKALNFKNLLGGSVTWEPAVGIAVRAAHLRGTAHTASDPPVDRFSFSGASVVLDRANWVAHAEYVTRRAATLRTAVNAQGWYLLAGHRFGALLPYGSWARSRVEPGIGERHSYPQQTQVLGIRWDFHPGTALKVQVDRIRTFGTNGLSFVRAVEGGAITDILPAINSGRENDTPLLPNPGGTFGVGASGVTRPVHVLSLAVDFVF